MSLSELAKYKGLDYSLDKNKDLFKQLYVKLLVSPDSAEHCLEVFNYLIRKLGVESKNYKGLKDYTASKTESGTTRPLYFDHYIDMYQLDMFSDWNENDPDSMLHVAMNMRIPPGKILNFCVKHMLYIGDSRLFDMLNEYASFDKYKNIPYNLFEKLNIAHPDLNAKAYTHYNSLKLTDRITEGLTTENTSLLHYMIAYGIDKYDFRPLIQAVDEYYRVDNLKLSLLYTIWLEKMKTQEYIADKLDFNILKSLLDLELQQKNIYSVIKLEHLMPMLRQEIEKNGYDLLSTLSIESLKSFIAEKWAIPYIKTMVDKITFCNDTRLKLLRTNSYSENESYKPDLIKEQFMLGLKENKNMMFYNLPFILPHATDIKNIIITPITSSALLLALLTIQSKNIKTKHAKALDKVFPGIMTETGKLELLERIEHLIPNAKTMLKLTSLYSEIEIINFAINEYKPPLTQEVLPEL